MTHARSGLWVASAALLAAAEACGAADSAFSLDSFGGADAGTKAPATSDATKGGNGSSSSGSGGASPSAAIATPQAEGVILVHAAKFPSFRLCFENAMELPPQPDETVMPEANVVGVEVGSVVRIDPLKPPGKIFVIREVPLRGKSGSCQKLFDDGLGENLDYQVTEPVNDPLGNHVVNLLAISGCGGRAFLPANTVEADCGADWQPGPGNLKGTVLVVPPANRAGTELPVQLFHLSPSIEAARGAGSLNVTFGPLDSTSTALPQNVAMSATLLQQSAPATLDIGEGDDAIFAKDGFRIEVLPPGGGPPTKLADQSLASVQRLSAPLDLPAPYYRAASNYALLLLGDPGAPRTLDGGPEGAPDPTFARRGVHLLAIPVIDPKTVDAGAPDAQAEDGG
jgi:hypothetical protein